MKTKVMVIIFAACVLYGMFAVIHHDSPSVKTAGGFDFWLYSGLGAIGIAVITALVGWFGQGKKS